MGRFPRKGGSWPEDTPVLKRDEQKTGEQCGHQMHSAVLATSDLHISEEKEGGRREGIAEAKTLQNQMY